MDLAVIGFIIAVVGIILQLADAFPEHRETRKVIVLLSVGVFIGIAASALLGTRYEIKGQVNAKYLLLLCIFSAAVVFAAVALLFRDEQRRAIATGTALVAVAVFCITGLGFGLAGARSPESYSTDEIMALADRAQQSGQYEVALTRLEEVRSRMKSDAAATAIQKRIESISLLQAGVRDH